MCVEVVGSVSVLFQVWDMNMESRPVEVYPVHDYLRSRLCSLYENDSIFDRFECSWNGDDTYPLHSFLSLLLPLLSSSSALLVNTVV